MRLLQINVKGDFSLVSFADNEVPQYAILSHVWGSDGDEVSFRDMQEGTGKGKSGYKKLLFCAAQAGQDHLKHFWLDTCCIDKSSSAELSESINSMFQWYRKSAKCYAYLSDVSCLGLEVGRSPDRHDWKTSFKLSKWFRRGWTLQELLAPTSIEFFSEEGNRLSDRAMMSQEINEITGISARALLGTPLSHFPVAERFSWIEGRKTSRKEDEAYCLLGILNVSMSVIYGEGRSKAFTRLWKEVRDSLAGETHILPSGTILHGSDQSQVSFATDIWDNATPRFWRCLDLKEQQTFRNFDSCENLLNSLIAKYEQTDKKYASRLCSQIRDFGTAWETLFRVMDFFAPTPPGSIGLALGAIHLLITLGMKHKTYLAKIVAMFQDIGSLLPTSETCQKMCTQDGNLEPASRHSSMNTQQIRLHKAVSKVCAEILNFCQESCRIFRTARSDVICRPTLIHASWVPFDARFTALLERLRSYQEIFEWELQFRESKSRERQMANQMDQLKKEDRKKEDIVLTQIQNQLEAVILSNGRRELEIMSKYYRIEDKACQQTCGENAGKAPAQEEIMIRIKASEISKWIDSPDYLQEFNKARKIRLPNTGGYMLADTTYKEWKLVPTIPEEGRLEEQTLKSPQILFAHGKPGFGKTVLSSVLIEDLQDLHIASTANLQDRGYVFFYHFTSERRYGCTPHDALKAVLAQIAHKYWYNSDILDRIAILRGSGGFESSTASDEDVLAAVLLLLESLDHTVLFFDGVDECEDHMVFLELIKSLCAATSTRVMLLGRANVELPIDFEHQSIHLRQSNLQDIRTFLEPKVLHWVDRELIPDTIAAGEIIEELALRSEGVFLWALLMGQYLNRKALSPKQRLEAIFEPTEFKGLHGIYTKILEMLDQGYERETANIQKIFELVATSFRPLSVVELQAALAVDPGKVTQASSYITEFKDCLPVICGALVEVQMDETVRFVHLSFRDFLLSGLSHRNNFLINERPAHIRCSTICLSYLIYDLPSSPLSPSTGALRAEHLETAFPFIKYSLRWVDHAVCGFRIGNVLENPLRADIYDGFYAILKSFINSPLTISVWIEAARTFCTKPTLESLVALYPSCASPLASASPFNTGKLAIILLGELNEDLKRLDEAWGYLLRKDPSAIWGPSITAFCKSAFWVETDATITTSLLPAEAVGTFRSGSRERPILVRSQVSSSGDEVGLVLVLPPRSYLATAEAVFDVQAKKSGRRASHLSEKERQDFIDFCSFGWKIRYQRRRIRSEEVTMDFEVNLPESQIRQMLQQCTASKAPHRFPFPVAFSHNLDRLVVLRSVVTIQHAFTATSNDAILQCRLQTLDRVVGTGLGCNAGDTTAFYSTFSPDSKALAFVFGRLEPKTIDSRRVQVWSDIAVNGSWPHYQCKGEILTSRLSWKEKVLGNPFIFHPYLPVLLYAQWNTTAAWKFNDLGPNAKTVISRDALTPLEVLPDGKYLRYRCVLPGNHGAAVTPNSDDDFRDEEYEPKFEEGLLALPESFFSGGRDQSLLHITASQSEETRLLNQKSRQDGSCLDFQIKTSELGVVVIDRQTSQHVVSEAPITTGTHVMAHLPRLRQGEETYVSLLPSTGQDEWVCMIWNKSAQDTYSIYDYQTPHLPSIISRRQGTIQPISEDRGAKRLKFK